MLLLLFFAVVGTYAFSPSGYVHIRPIGTAKYVTFCLINRVGQSSWREVSIQVAARWLLNSAFLSHVLNYYDSALRRRTLAAMLRHLRSILFTK